MQNLRHIDFGIRHCGSTVSDVDLPPWAENHSDFVEKLSQAMESDYVSRYIYYIYTVYEKRVCAKIWHYLQPAAGGKKKYREIELFLYSTSFFVSFTSMYIRAFAPSHESHFGSETMAHTRYDIYKQLLSQ